MNINRKRVLPTYSFIDNFIPDDHYYMTDSLKNVVENKNSSTGIYHSQKF